jgi:transcriptional regulator with GAF, ATPase, and Fis domain
MQNPQQTYHQTDQVIELAFALSQQNDFREMTRLVVQNCIALLDAELALIVMVNPRTRDTIKTIMREGHFVENSKYRPVQNQISGWVMKNNAPLLSEDIQNDARFAKVQFGSLDIASVIGVPLRIEGLIIGAVMALKKSGQKAFVEQDVTLLEKIAIIAAPYLRNGHNLRAYFEKPLPVEALLPKYAENGLLGRSPKFIALLRSVDSAARSDVRVLLEGESGTGKELVAQAIHCHSARNGKPFVAVDCGAISVHLIESELFGHVKGAFTGAVTDRKGLFEEADGGTLFMDEITNLPPELLNEMKQARKVFDESYLSKSLAESVSELEAQLIRQALQASDGNQSQAARLLKIPVQTLRYKIEKLGLTV